MKLATYHDGSRDGQLVVVSRDLTLAAYASASATRLQQVLDDWNFLSPQLEDLYLALNQGKARHAMAFEPERCLAPLPRAHQWAGGAAYLEHVRLLRRARGVEVPEWLHAEPLLYQGGGDTFLGPCDDARFASEEADIDFDAELAVVTGDLPAGASPEQSLEGIRLLMLANNWSLRRLLGTELGRGFGFVHGKPAVAFSPVAVTPDELGPAWSGGRVHLALHSARNGERFGAVDAGSPMHFHFGQLIAHLARTRPVRAGAIVGSGAVSHTDRAQGCSCIAEQRAIEMLDAGEARTGWMRFGDTVRIEMPGADGSSVFGAIEQRVVGPGGEPAAVNSSA